MKLEFIIIMIVVIHMEKIGERKKKRGRETGHFKINLYLFILHQGNHGWLHFLYTFIGEDIIMVGRA